MKRYQASAWKQGTGLGSVEACKGCSMRVIKFFEGKSTTPQYAAFIRQDERGHLLINEPTSKPYGKRTARWLDPEKVRVEWIRDFGGVKAMEGM